MLENTVRKVAHRLLIDTGIHPFIFGKIYYLYDKITQTSHLNECLCTLKIQ